MQINVAYIRWPSHSKYIILKNIEIQLVSQLIKKTRFINKKLDFRSISLEPIHDANSTMVWLAEGQIGIVSLSPPTPTQKNPRISTTHVGR